MMKPLSIIPYFHYEKPENWEHIKTELLSFLSYLNNQERRDIERFYSSANHSEESMVMLRDKFISLMSDKLQEFGREVGAQSFEIENIWAVSYEKGDFHDVHNHGIDGMTGILYLDYDENEHPPTTYVGANNFMTGHTQLSSPAVKEGDLVFVPSSVLHYTRPNESDKTKTSIAFDLVLKK
jgi:hypothetical protein